MQSTAVSLQDKATAANQLIFQDTIGQHYIFIIKLLHAVMYIILIYNHIL